MRMKNLSSNSPFVLLLTSRWKTGVNDFMGLSENRDTNQVASVNFFVGEAESRSNTVCIARLDNEAYGKIYSKMIVKEVFRGSLKLFPQSPTAAEEIFLHRRG